MSVIWLPLWGRAQRSLMVMKRLILCISAFVALSLAASAQMEILTTPFNRISWGARVSGDILNPSRVSSGYKEAEVFKAGGGASLGAVCDIPIVTNLYLEPGFKFYCESYSVNKRGLRQISSLMKSITLIKTGMRIPLMLGYHFDFWENAKVHIFSGPELEVGFSATSRTKKYNSHYDTDRSYSIITENLYGGGGGMRRLDLLWNIGVGLEFDKLYLGLTSSAGMLNMYTGGDMKYNENRINITVGYNFDIPR